MPTPTREQFEAAQRRVIANAPAGLSRDQFFELINRELSIPDPTQFEVGGPSDNVLHPKPILGQRVADALTKPLLNVPVVGPLTSPASLALMAGGALSGVRGASPETLRSIGNVAGDVKVLEPGALVKRGMNALADRAEARTGAAGSPNATWKEIPAPPAPAPKVMPGESMPGFPKVGSTPAPPAPPQRTMPGESVPGYPMEGSTPPSMQSVLEGLMEPGESLPGYPKYTETPPVANGGASPSSLGEGAPVSPSTENVSGASATPDIAPAQAAGIRPPQQPINDLVPPSRSSAGAGRDGLTEADRAAAGINPAMTITKVPETTAEMINRARGARRQNYKTAAEEESVRQSSMARDPQEPVDVSGEQLQELLRQMRGEP